ncbi:MULTISPECIES: PsbP-related protein [Nostoc]|uniref:DUF1795 domain-containing protein n=1 Tax=Nostoc punctiforme FACHB-252 TaxID=1357509 RepID=A0ABR8H4I1_NOSPU|nr:MULTISPECIES: PsbP-related protein [Nostoc]MBC1239083.1 hypothetical protein [Nostoc sp. 2RC]MBD2610182.1 hypothetical protein [Nostoc punctiforme FACHB-252]
MMKKYFSCCCLVTISIILLPSGAAHSQIISVPTIQFKQSERTLSRFKTYISPNKFSVQYPKGWFITPSDDTIMIHNFVFRRPAGGELKAGEIKTDINIFNQSFESTKQSYTKGRIKKQIQLKIGNRKALRIWAIEEFNESITIHTIVQYRNNQTFLISSFSEGLTPSMVNTIQTVHGSFRILE